MYWSFSCRWHWVWVIRHLCWREGSSSAHHICTSLLINDGHITEPVSVCHRRWNIFQNDLSLLQDLIIFSMNPPEQFVLPSYQRLFQLVRLADFIGCEKFLEMVAGRLGVVVLTIKYGVHWRNPLSITSDWLPKLSVTCRKMISTFRFTYCAHLRVWLCNQSCKAMYFYSHAYGLSPGSPSPLEIRLAFIFFSRGNWMYKTETQHKEYVVYGNLMLNTS